LIIGPLLYVGALWLSVPRDQIIVLKSGFVAVEVSEEASVTYTITSDRPAQWVDYGELDQKVKMAFVISEDWSFYEHRGVDFAQLERAIKDALFKGQRLRGASTISQQLVKNLFLTHERTLYRKLSELLITRHLEQELSKQKILEVYLNIVQFGEGVYGIHSAAEHYFKVGPQQLNVKEAAFLAMLLPNPVRYAKSYHERALTDYAAQTVNAILEKLKVQGTLSEQELKRARSMPLRFDGPPARREQRRARQPRLKLDDDGSAFERAYMVDDELTLDTPNFDPSVIPIPKERIDVEFSLE
jgi:monofunctional glycosyltransferase